MGWALSITYPALGGRKMYTKIFIVKDEVKIPPERYRRIVACQNGR